MALPLLVPIVTSLIPLGFEIYFKSKEIKEVKKLQEAEYLKQQQDDAKKQRTK